MLHQLQLLCQQSSDCKHRYVIWVISDNNFLVCTVYLWDAANRHIWNSYIKRMCLVLLRPISTMFTEMLVYNKGNLRNKTRNIQNQSSKLGAVTVFLFLSLLAHNSKGKLLWLFFILLLLPSFCFWNSAFACCFDISCCLNQWYWFKKKKGGKKKIPVSYLERIWLALVLKLQVNMNSTYTYSLLYIIVWSACVCYILVSSILHFLFHFVPVLSKSSLLSLV